MYMCNSHPRLARALLLKRLVMSIHSGVNVRVRITPCVRSLGRTRWKYLGLFRRTGFASQYNHHCQNKDEYGNKNDTADRQRDHQVCGGLFLNSACNKDILSLGLEVQSKLS